MADPFLPPDYQAELDTATRRQKLAQMLAERGLNLQAPQAQGAQAARISPLAAIASALTGVAGGYLGNKADQDIQNVRRKFATDETADVERLQGMAEPEAIKAGQTSQFARSRALAETLQKQAEKRRELQSGVYKDAGQVSQALSVLDGSPVAPMTPPKAPEVSSVMGPDGKPIPMLVNYDKHGIPKGTLGAQGTTIQNNLPKEEGKMVVGQIGDTLKEQRGRADAARQTIAATNQALDALEQGATPGGGGAFKQAARKAAQAFGIQLPETAGNEQLSMALLQGVIGQAKNLRPASDQDMKTLMLMAGSINTDPTALSKALAFAQSMALQDLDRYNQYAAENKKSLDPNIQNLFAGATSGYELPEQLTGPVPYQLEVIKNLQRNGMDISRFRDPSGQPFPKDAKFNISPAAAFPGTADTAQPNTPSLQSLLPGQKPQFEEGKVYVDANGNKAKYQNGQWVPVQ